MSVMTVNKNSCGVSALNHLAAKSINAEETASSNLKKQIKSNNRRSCKDVHLTHSCRVLTLNIYSCPTVLYHL